ncbi:hypothetical protein [Haloglomus halophilum]|jgi:hypothetical protein|uniref:hypothetical protein n=1 Tax=Haloglomus halophilum TaxID=2962672 RepID=UPI0020C9C317|nr:hypothetical protein [Haloglomus halophilum]
MGEYTESDISYLRGRIEGFLQGVARQTPGSKEFDQDQWESLYGTRIIYDNVPAYPSREAHEQDRGGFVLCNWDDATDTKYLKEGIDLPRDRPGTLVAEDGTVVISRQSDLVMFQLDERDRQLIEEWDELLLETIRKVYDTSPST